MALAQQTRLVRVDSPLGAEVLQLQRMEGREELGTYRSPTSWN